MMSAASSICNKNNIPENQNETSNKISEYDSHVTLSLTEKISNPVANPFGFNEQISVQSYSCLYSVYPDISFTPKRGSQFCKNESKVFCVPKHHTTHS
jgi:hypothetical protein